MNRLRRWSVRSWILALALVCLAGLAQAADGTSGLLSEPGATFTLPVPWTLIAYGDMRFTDPANRTATDPVVRQALIRKIAEERPNVLLLSGDVPWHGGNENDYAVYQQETAPWRAAGIKVFPALGNHELSDPGHVRPCEDCLENWWKTFPELRGRRWYSVRFGEAYIVTLDSNLDLTADSEQGKWLAGQLHHLPEGVRYVFVSLHHPPVADPIHDNPSHNVRPNETALAQQLEAAARHIRAKIIVIAGHIHAYERFERGGVEYLVCGGGGAKPYPIDRSPAALHQDNVFPNYQYVKFVSRGGELHATMYRLDNNGSFVASDTFTIGEPAVVNAKK